LVSQKIVRSDNEFESPTKSAIINALGLLESKDSVSTRFERIKIFGAAEFLNKQKITLRNS